MKAAVLFESNKPLELVDVDLSPLRPNQARVRVEASGVCHTDLAMSRLPVRAPIVLGHEGVGTVVEVGDQVTRVKVGDRVIGSFVATCGHCFYCVRGASTQCEASTTTGSRIGSVRDSPLIALAGLGSFAELMTVAEISLVPVETDLPAEQLALIGCGVTTGAGSVLWAAGVEPGSTVAVYGCGGVGLFAVQGARIAGAERIFVVDPVQSKRDAALSVGATDTIDPAEGDPVEQIRALTSGRGTDYAFEVVGRASVINQAYDTVRPRGTVVVVGMSPPDSTVTLPSGMMFRTEKRLMGSFYGSAQVLRDMPILVRLAESGKLDIGSAISRRIELSQIDDAFRALESGEVIRSVIVPNA